MTDKEFIDRYWKQYIMIEKEFKASFKYVALDIDNYSAYSDVYAKVLLQVGSEVDVIAKVICRKINTSSCADSISRYQIEICSHFSEFEDVIVKCGDEELRPWKGWAINSPIWWRVYNGVKHNRNSIETYESISKENYKFANQGNVLDALAALYQLEQYLYTLIPHYSYEETPLPGSRLFILNNQGWEKKKFGHDSFFYIKDECLYYSNADVSYSDI